MVPFLVYGIWFTLSTYYMFSQGAYPYDRECARVFFWRGITLLLCLFYLTARTFTVIAACCCSNHPRSLEMSLMFKFKVFEVLALTGAVVWIRWDFSSVQMCNRSPNKFDPTLDSWWGIVDFGSILLMFYCIFTFNNWVCYLLDIWRRRQHSRRQQRANERQHRQSQQQEGRLTRLMSIAGKAFNTLSDD